MSGIELVAALLSFVYALALTHILQTATDMWLARDRVILSWPLLGWAALALLTLVNNWLALIPLAKADWSAPVVLVSFLTAVVQYFTCSLVAMKASEHGPIDMRAFEARQHLGYKVAYLALCVLVIVSNGMQYTLWAGEPFSWKGMLNAHLMVLCNAAAIVVSIPYRARWYQVALPWGFTAYLAFLMTQA